MEFCFSNNMLLEQCVLCTVWQSHLLKILSEWVESVTKFMTGRFRRCKEKRFSIGCSFWRSETLWPRVARIICIVCIILFCIPKGNFHRIVTGFFSSIVTAVTDNHMIYRMSYVSEIWNSLAIRVQLNVFGMLMICNTCLELHYHNVL